MVNAVETARENVFGMCFLLLLLLLEVVVDKCSRVFLNTPVPAALHSGGGGI